MSPDPADRRPTEADRRRRRHDRVEAEERFETLHPEAAWSRRQFLARTAALAGAAGLASVLPAEALIGEAARTQARRPFPSPSNLPIDTFVVLMMENRSFDHYFGWFPDADGRNEGLSYPDAEGNQVPTHHLTPDYQGCDFRDPDHSWDGGRHQLGGGNLDGFVQGDASGTGSDEYAAGYYLEDDLPFISKAAGAYTLYDRYFCSIMASTYPNRHFQISAQSGGTKNNVIPTGTLGHRWETIFDRALANGISIGYYFSDLPVPALYGARGLLWLRPVASFYLDAALGNLPHICFVDPPFVDGGGGNGVSADDHPHGDIRLGQAFMSDIAHAFMASPQYRRGAMFVNYDEWGGFFDHVVPPRVPDDRASSNLFEDFGLAGFRNPAVAISPFARGGGVNHATFTHESILKLISYKFGFGYLNKRHEYASNIGRSFDFESPDFDPPQLPDPAAVASIPCSLQAGSTARPEQHDLMRMETSGYLDRLGFDAKPARFEDIYRDPDKIRDRLRRSTKIVGGEPGGDPAGRRAP